MDRNAQQSNRTATADALVVVDMQNGFARGQDMLVQRIRNVASEFPPERIVWLKFRNHPGSMYARHLDWHSVSVSPETDIVTALQPLVRPDNVLEHSTYYPPTELTDKLNACHEVAVVGMDTDACVYATALFLWDQDIRPLILQDCCMSYRGPAFHRIGLDLMRRQFGVAAILDKVLPIDLKRNAPAATTVSGP